MYILLVLELDCGNALHNYFQYLEGKKKASILQISSGQAEMLAC